MADKKVSIGGQALIEGIMMKGPHSYSIAVRTPDGGINVKKYKVKPGKFTKIPVLRGMYSFIDSLITGYKSIMASADAAMVDLEEDELELWLKKHFGDKAADILLMIAGVLGGMLALVLFMVLPTTFTGIIDKIIPLGGLKAAVEGVSKLIIFIVYLWLVSKMSEIKRVFAYHGAEHKTIACYEAGEELTVENVRKHTRFHPRCGTSFMFIVLLVSIAVFSFVPWQSTLGRVVMKVAFLPVVVGIAYEILRYTGRHTNACTRIMATPGLWFQRLTTNEPEDDMIEVAIASVNAILPETIVKKPVPEQLNEETAPEPEARLAAAAEKTATEENRDYVIPVSNRLNDVYRAMQEILAENENSDPRFEAAQLVQFVLGADRLTLGPDYEMTDEQKKKLIYLAGKRAGGYPLQYILGTWQFFDLDLDVGEGVLIPRADTEDVVMAAVQQLKDTACPAVIDLCSGSGAIALAVKRFIPDASVVAVEKYDEAFAYLERNIEKTGLMVLPVKYDIFNYDFVCEEEAFDMIISNPPYIDPRMEGKLQTEVSYEPGTALFAEDYGLRFYKFIAQNYYHALKDGGYLVFEHGYDQSKEVENILVKARYTVVQRIVDTAGNPRGIIARKD
ncbi:MAG: peptide chain release factor N(5)-glutamine methyltransferase [Oscillospiraceae bacterium]|nr:peptide chain release factor N(5)-glutamine methyltransferase [Oscillospiraceae bacterium]